MAQLFGIYGSIIIIIIIMFMLMPQSRQTYMKTINQASVISLSVRSSVMSYGVMFITANACDSSALTRHARWTN